MRSSNAIATTIKESFLFRRTLSSTRFKSAPHGFQLRIDSSILLGHVHHVLQGQRLFLQKLSATAIGEILAKNLL